jgi:hypothetical protein
MAPYLPATHLYPLYHQVDTIGYGVRTGAVGFGAGLFSACMKNAYFSTSSSAWGVISIYGATIPIYGQPTSSMKLTSSCGLWGLWTFEGVTDKFPSGK